MKFIVNIEKTRAYLPIMVDEVVSETQTILAVSTEPTLDPQGQSIGLLKTVDVYGNINSYPLSAIKRITTCFATKVNLKSDSKVGVSYIRHPAIYKWDGNDWIEKPSKLIFDTTLKLDGAEYSNKIYLYHNPELP